MEYEWDFPSMWFLSWFPGDRVAAYKTVTEPKGYIAKMKFSRREFYGRHLTWLVEYMCHKWPRILIACRNCNPIIWSCIIYHGICSKRKRKMTKNIYKTLHRTLKIIQHEPNKKTGVHSFASYFPFLYVLSSVFKFMHW